MPSSSTGSSASSSPPSGGRRPGAGGSVWTAIDELLYVIHPLIKLRAFCGLTFWRGGLEDGVCVGCLRFVSCPDFDPSSLRGQARRFLPSAARKMGRVWASASSDCCGDGGKGQDWEELRSGLALKSGGLEYAVNRSGKWIVSVLFAVLIVGKHDAEALWMTMGSVINYWLSITLKHLLKHERPVPALKSGPGMPSFHAQSIFYAVVFAVLSTFRRLGINTHTISGGVLVAAGWYLSRLRVTQQFHTIKQVAVGAILGTIFSTSWYFLWHLICP